MSILRRASAAAWRAVAIVALEVSDRTEPTLVSRLSFGVYVVAAHRARVLGRA